MKDLTKMVTASLPSTMHIAGINIARSSGSTYWLLRQSSQWLTLRLATHPHWLRGVRQLQVVLPASSARHDSITMLTKALASPAAAKNTYAFTAIDTALANMLLWTASRKLVFMLRLTPEMATTHKMTPFSLQQDFAPLPLFLGDRNNSNDLLLPVHDAKLQQSLIDFYSANLLFTQFSSHQLVKLLPTAQWLQTILTTVPTNPAWPLTLATTFGTELLDVIHRARM
ncbi:MAG: hypothetical protein ABF494_04770 [Lacticaseibacillus paracasei]